MKKKIKLMILVIIIALIGGFIYYVFSEVTPYDDTKKLYINCNNIHKSYNVLSSDKINFAENDTNCKLNFEVRNVDRSFIKLKTTDYYYRAKTNGTVDEETSPTNDIYVEPDKDLIIYTLDKSTKIIFEYK